MEPAREPTRPVKPPHPDDPILTREPLTPGRAPERVLRRVLNVLSLLVVLALACAGFQSWRSHPIAAQVTPTLTAHPTPIPTPPTPAPTLPPGKGWVPAGPIWAQQIAFAPSAPNWG
jgi:hypothetical protein